MRQRASRANEGGEGDDFGSASDNASFGGHQPYHSTLGQMAEKVKSGGGSSGSSSGAYDMGDDGNEEDDDEFDPSICAPGSEHTGRWTRKEHELFLEALKKYGKEWKKVASMVKTRTVVQTRTHAQKYFQKVMKSGGGGVGDSGDDDDDFDGPATVSVSAGKKATPPVGTGIHTRGASIRSDGSSIKRGPQPGGGLPVAHGPGNRRFKFPSSASSSMNVGSGNLMPPMMKTMGGGSGGMIGLGSGGPGKGPMNLHNNRHPQQQLITSSSMGYAHPGMPAMSSLSSSTPGMSGGGGGGGGGSGAFYPFAAPYSDLFTSGGGVAQHQTPRSGMFIQLPSGGSQASGSGGSMNSMYMKGDDGLEHTFTQPSPAACGKRKMAELSAAEMLASTSAGKGGGGGGKNYSYTSYSGSSGSKYARGIAEGDDEEEEYVNDDDEDLDHMEEEQMGTQILSSESLMEMEGEGAQVLFMLKDSNAVLSPRGLGAISPLASIMATGRGLVKGEMPDHSSMFSSYHRNLSIINPETFYTGDGYEAGGSLGGADTPWEKEVRALDVRSNFAFANTPSFPRSRLNALAHAPSSSSASLSAAAAASTMILPVPTPSEQRDFHRQVVALIDKGFEGLTKLDGLLQTTRGVQCSSSSVDGGGGDGTEAMLEIATSRLLNRQDTNGQTILMLVCDPNSANIRKRDDTDFCGTGVTTNSNVKEESAGVPPSSSSSSTSSSLPTSTGQTLKEEGMSGGDTNDEMFPHDEELMLAICQILLRHGASAKTADSDGSTCLHRVAEMGFDKVGRFLCIQGCPINAVNTSGDAAVHIAARGGHMNFLKMLVDLGANCHIRNGQSRCALDILGADIGGAGGVTSSSSSSSTSMDSQESMRTRQAREDLRRILLTAEPRLRTLILHHPDCLEHSSRRPSEWEGPDRLEGILRNIQDVSVFPEYELEITSQFKKASVELLGRVHSAEYIAFVDALSKQVQQMEENNEGGSSTSDGGFHGISVPFTPQVQKHILHRSKDDVKDADVCDTTFSSGTLRAARRAAGAVAYAVDRVLTGRNRNAFCVVRPPGHHAGYEGLFDGAKSCGFCIFNSVAAGALHALDPEGHNCPRVAVVDLDIHHGNGTEDIVRRYAHPSRLFFFSLHLFDKEHGSTASHIYTSTSSSSHASTTTAASSSATSATSPSSSSSSLGVGYEFFPGSGAEDDIKHNIVNVPIPPMWHNDDNHSNKHSTRGASNKVPTGPLTGREAYRQAVVQRLIPSLRAFNPGLILLSMGFDAALGDVGNSRVKPLPTGHGTESISGMDLRNEDFEWATVEVMKIADICCRGQVVSVLEGGYGSYTPKPKAGGHKGTVKHGGGGGGGKNKNSPQSTATQEAAAAESGAASTDANPMNRSILASAAVAHVRRLSDPYGPLGAPSTVGGVTVAANSSSSAAHGKSTGTSSSSSNTGGSAGASSRRVQSCPHLSVTDSLPSIQPPGPGPYTSSSTASESSMASVAAMQSHDPPVNETQPTTVESTDHPRDTTDTESGKATLAVATDTTNDATVS